MDKFLNYVEHNRPFNHIFSTKASISKVKNKKLLWDKSQFIKSLQKNKSHNPRESFMNFARQKGKKKKKKKKMFHVLFHDDKSIM